MRDLLHGLRGLRRSLRIWRAVLQLLLGLWWDAASWTYPGGVSDDRRAARQRRRARARSWIYCGPRRSRGWRLSGRRPNLVCAVDA